MNIFLKLFVLFTLLCIYSLFYSFLHQICIRTTYLGGFYKNWQRREKIIFTSRPHDHNRDYIATPICNKTRAIYDTPLFTRNINSKLKKALNKCLFLAYNIYLPASTTNCLSPIMIVVLTGVSISYLILVPS